VSTLPVAAGSAVPYLYYVDPVEGLDPYTGRPVAPTTLIDTTPVIDRKAAMLACHASQCDWLREHHGMDRYLEAMKHHGAGRGKLIQRPYAEAFVQHRGHAFPNDDLLRQILP
jgi:LmbE family N-acetylglucosaminyl deacetylase